MGWFGDGGNSNDGGTWHAAGEQFKSVREYGDAFLEIVGFFFAKYGWTIVAILVIWYNVHGPMKERLTRWKK